MGWSSLADLFNRISTWLPILTKQQRWKAEQANLLKEQDALLSQPTTPDNSRRLGAILSRLHDLDKLLQASS